MVIRQAGPRDPYFDSYQRLIGVSGIIAVGERKPGHLTIRTADASEPTQPLPTHVEAIGCERCFLKRSKRFSIALFKSTIHGFSLLWGRFARMVLHSECLHRAPEATLTAPLMRLVYLLIVPTATPATKRTSHHGTQAYDAAEDVPRAAQSCRSGAPGHHRLALLKPPRAIRVFS